MKQLTDRDREMVKLLLGKEAVDLLSMFAESLNGACHHKRCFYFINSGVATDRAVTAENRIQELVVAAKEKTCNNWSTCRKRRKFCNNLCKLINDEEGIE